jgi:hypothetical protein
MIKFLNSYSVSKTTLINKIEVKRNIMSGWKAEDAKAVTEFEQVQASNHRL